MTNFIGKVSGIKFPFKFQNGRVAVSTGEQHIKECLMHLITTGKLEYLMKPDFGTDINNRVFDTTNIIPLLESDIRTAIKRFEPRVELIELEAQMDKFDLGVIFLSIQISVKGVTSPINIEMPIRR